jgi:hypothetical protein
VVIGFLFQFSWEEPKAWGEILVAQISHLWWFWMSFLPYKKAVPFVMVYNSVFWMKYTTF